jgi:hypothetical protein
MKVLLTALCLIFLAKTASAQSDLLAFDEHNKYIYYQVVEMPGIPADTLYYKGTGFFKKDYPKIKLKTTSAGSFSGDGKFLTYGGVSILKHENGEIRFQVNVEFKDQKYRYWITGFVFTPYQRDRYGNFVPEVGIDIPLETANTKLDKKDVAAYLDTTGAYCKQFGEALKQYIIKAPAPKKEEITKKVVSDKW